MNSSDQTASQHIHIGTSGWSYKHWYHNFYPPGLNPDKFLEYYLSCFSCVELNSSFYHLPKEATIAVWIRRTPETFLFCPKLSRFISHQKRLKDVDEPMNKYFQLFEKMKSRLGPVLIQLPPGLHHNKSLIRGFFDLLEEHYSAYQFAIEIRHKSWINEDFLQLCGERKIAFVMADSGKRFPYYEAVTADFVYLRFHGGETLYATDYTEEQLQYYAVKIKDWNREGKKVWAFFNNDFEGFAVKNAYRLRELVDEREE